MHRAPIRPRTH